MDNSLSGFEVVASLMKGMGQMMGLPANSLFAGMETPPLPVWCDNIFDRLKRTIFKKFLKLNPSGKTMVPYWYGKMIGLVIRYSSFLAIDAPRISESEGLGNLTDEEQKKILEGLGYEKHRPEILRMLQLPDDDPTATETLLQVNFEKHQQFAGTIQVLGLALIANMKPPDQALFTAGLNEGQALFLNEKGSFTGESRRVEIYFSLLGSCREIEEMRRTTPATSRAKLLSWLEAKHGKPLAVDPKVFFDVCRDIRLVMKQPGRPRKP